MSLDGTFYHVARGDQRLGKLSVAEIAVAWQESRLVGSDLCWSKGMSGWLPLGEVFEFEYVTDTASAPHIAEHVETSQGKVSPEYLPKPPPLPVTASGASQLPPPLPASLFNHPLGLPPSAQEERFPLGPTSAPVQMDALRRAGDAVVNKSGFSWSRLGWVAVVTLVAGLIVGGGLWQHSSASRAEQSSASQASTMPALTRLRSLLALEPPWRDPAQMKHELGVTRQSAEAHPRDVIIKNNPAPPVPEQALADFKLGQEKGRTDPAEARKLFARAAARGHVLAGVYLGLMHERGLGGPVDLTQALFCLRDAASMGHREAMAHAGEILCELADQNYDFSPEGLAWLKEAAARGSLRGMTLLAAREWQKIYGDDEARLQLQKSGLELLKKAADKGYAEALFELGRYHENGRGGLPADEQRAFDYYRQAAKLGLAEAQELYAMGLLRRNMPGPALEMHHEAAAKGCEGSLNYLADIYEAGRPGNSPPGPGSKELRLLRQGACLGHAPSQQRLADALLLAGGSRHLDQAVDWASCAMELRNADAMTWLAIQCLKKENSPLRTRQVIALLDDSIALGSSTACVVYARALRNGQLQASRAEDKDVMVACLLLLAQKRKAGVAKAELEAALELLDEAGREKATLVSEDMQRQRSADVRVTPGPVMVDPYLPEQAQAAERARLVKAAWTQLELAVQGLSEDRCRWKWYIAYME